MSVMRLSRHTDRPKSTSMNIAPQRNIIDARTLESSHRFLYRIQPFLSLPDELGREIV